MPQLGYVRLSDFVSGLYSRDLCHNISEVEDRGHGTFYGVYDHVTGLDSGE